MTWIILLGLCVLAMIYVFRKWDARITRQIQQARSQAATRRIENLRLLEEALEQWLLVLELPQFEEETKRQEAARQLSALLIVRLMLAPYPDQHATNHRPL